MTEAADRYLLEWMMAKSEYENIISNDVAADNRAINTQDYLWYFDHNLFIIRSDLNKKLRCQLK